MTKRSLRASELTWFPTVTPDRLPERELLEHVLGQRGCAFALSKGEALARMAFGHLESRGIYLSDTLPATQLEVAQGLCDWFEHGKDDLLTMPLEGCENIANNRIRWQPGKQASFQATIFQLLVALYHAVQSGDQGGLQEAQKFLGNLPPDLDSANAEWIVKMLTSTGDTTLSGAPGRLAVLPIFSENWAELPPTERPEISFAALYLPFDPRIRERLRAMRIPPLEAPPDDRIGPQYFDPRESFPGSLAYARISVYVKEGEEGVGVIHHARFIGNGNSVDFAPNSPRAEFFALFDSLFEELGCDRIYFPTAQTVEANAKFKRLDSAQVEASFGTPPKGYDRDPVSYLGQNYYLRTLSQA